MHYKRWRRHGDPRIAFASRQCEYCGEAYMPTGTKQKACAKCSHLVDIDYSQRYEAERRGDRTEYRKRYNRSYWARNSERLSRRNAEWARANREAINAYRVEWYARNAERQRAYHREHYRTWGTRNRDRLNGAAHRRRSRTRDNGIYRVSASDIRKMRARQSGECSYCGRVANLTVDHIIPIARGGSHSPGNLILACGPCNRSKGARTVMEWRVWKQRQGLAA